MDQKEFVHNDCFQMRPLLSKTLGKILLSVEPIFAISAITSSFQVYFGSVNYRFEEVHAFPQMMENWSPNY